MGEKTAQGILVVVLISFVVFGATHDLDRGPHESAAAETTVEHAETIPHVEEICTLTLIGAGLLVLNRHRSLVRRSSAARTPYGKTSSFVDPRASSTNRCTGFQSVFPMLA